MTITGRSYQNTQQALVMSQLVLNAALQESNVAAYRMVREQADPVAWLRDTLSVEFAAGSEVMEISLSGSDPEELAGLVNAVKKAYMDEVAGGGRHESAKAPSRQAQADRAGLYGNPQGAAGTLEETRRDRGGRRSSRDRGPQETGSIEPLPRP